MFKSLFTSVLVMFLVLGCGEGFRSQQSSNNSDQTTGGFFDEGDEFFDGETATSKDLAIRNTYSTELDGKENATLQLAATVKALDVNFNLVKSDDSVFRVNALITFGCKNSILIDKNIKKNSLHTMERVSLGEKKGYSVRLQCTDVQCGELVAAISKENGFFPQTVLVGMKAATIKNDTLVYVSRNVNVPVYFAAYSNGGYYKQTNGCSMGTGNALIDSIINYGAGKSVDLITEGAGNVQNWLNNIF